MRSNVRRLISDEKGKVLVLALAMLVVGGLLLGPLLGLMGTGLAAGQTYEKKSDELYAADAGVENAIWHLERGGNPGDVLTFTLNGKDVVVTMTYLNPGNCSEPAMYEIVSTATGEDGSSTTVTAHVTNITVYFEGDKQLDAGDYYGTHIYVEGTLTLNADSEVAGNVMAGGDIILNAGALVGGVVCVGGNLETNNEAGIEADVYVEGYVKMTGSSYINGDVHARKYVTMDGEFVNIQGDVYAGEYVSVGGKSARIESNVYSGGDVTVDGQSARIAGNVCAVGSVDEERVDGEVCEYCSCDYDNWACPLGFTDPEIKVWLIT